MLLFCSIRGIGVLIMQKSLFDDLDSYSKDIKDGMICIKCNVLLPLSDFGIRASYSGGFPRTECKKCTSKLDKVRKKLRQEFPPPDEQTYICPICFKGYDELKGRGGKGRSAFVMDHCHSTDTFRGYICHSCNRGVFKDEIKIVERFLNYLKEHQRKLDEGIIISRR